MLMKAVISVMVVMVCWQALRVMTVIWPMGRTVKGVDGVGCEDVSQVTMRMVFVAYKRDVAKCGSGVASDTGGGGEP